MSAKKSNCLIEILSSLIIILLIVGVVGFFALFTNGFRENFKTFSVKYGFEIITSPDNKITFERGKEHKLDVIYVFSAFSKEENLDYNVKIIANTKKSFDFTVNNEKQAFGKQDLTKVFNLQKHDKFFTFNIPVGIDLQSVLNDYYKGKTVVLPTDLKDDDYYYTLVVTSFDNKITYNIDFNISAFITIDKEEIVF